MKNISTAELHLHSQILLNPGTAALTRLIDHFAGHLLQFLEKSYRRHLVNQKHLISEAVYNTLEWYHEHPMMYNSSQGSLRRFLELRADKNLQQIFVRENHPVHIGSLDHVLARHFDNERDVQYARLILKNEHRLVWYIGYVDVSSMRFVQVQSEIKRHKRRVQQKLSGIRQIKLISRTSAAPIVYLQEPVVRREAAVGNVR